MGRQIFVVKKSGLREAFSESKVLRSMERVGLPEELRPKVLAHIKSKLHDNIKTSEIFGHILEYLKEKHPQSSLRFNLKQAIFDLGPTGFPFERYIARIFKDLGYTTQVDLILQGDCVTHEVDILLEKNGRKEAIEAKFHNEPGVKTDVHVALYTYARFLDLKEKNSLDNVWIVTNTKLSDEAIAYSRCKKIRLIAWNYPEVGSLQDFVEDPHLYPVTILIDLSQNEKQRLLEKDIVLCIDLLEAQDKVLTELVGREKLAKVRESAHLLSEHKMKKPQTTLPL